MKLKTRHFRLEGGTPDGARRFISDRVDARVLGESTTTMVTITRTGIFHDPRYGEFEITREMLLSMVRNFDANVYGQKIFLDVAHDPSQGAAGEFKKLILDGNKLRGEVLFTPYGLDAVKKRGMVYLSAEFMDNYVDNEQRKPHGPTLLGAALTPRPVIKRLDPVQLSEAALDGAPATYLDTRISTFLKDEAQNTMKELLKKLQEALAKLTLAEPIIKQLCEAFEAVAKPIADEKIQLAIMEAFSSQGKLLAEQIKAAGTGDATIKLDMTGLEKILSEHKPTSAGLSADDVKKLLAEHETEQAKTLAEQKKKHDANVKLFGDTIDAAEGLKTLSDDQMKLIKNTDLINGDLTEAQVKEFAEHQIKMGNQLAASTTLAHMGYQGPQGVVHVSQNATRDILSLQEDINKALRVTSAHTTGDIILAENAKLHPFAIKVLAEFDRLNAPRLLRERKMLSGGEVGTSDTSLPVGFQRTVIIEALSDVRVLDVVTTLVDPNATATMDIPYETRDSSAVLNDGIVYEGQPIHRASVSQAMDLAYVTPMKLGFLISNEVMHFSRTSAINWEAYGRNVATNARIMKELVVRRICNEIQRSADAYGAVAVTGEAFDAQLDSATSVLKTTNFPIVRPYQARDLQGNAIGSAENAIAVVLNGVTLAAYDGSGTQSAGTYYQVTNYNLGYIQLVDELGAAVTPADTGVNTLGYSYATNIEKFDLDNGSVDLAVHRNGLLRAFGNRKSAMNQDRYINPNFTLMSYTLNNSCSQASQFESASKKSGTDTNNDGDLEMVKGLPAFSTNAPSIDLGDERAIIGLRGTLSYGIAKPFMTGDAFEAVDATTGKAIGKKQAYGEEYNAIKVPTPIRKQFTSIIAYSVTGR